MLQEESKLLAKTLPLGALLFALMVWRVGWPSQFSDVRTVVLLCAAGGPLMTGIAFFTGQPWPSQFERWVSYAGIGAMWALALAAFILGDHFRGGV